MEGGGKRKSGKVGCGKLDTLSKASTVKRVENCAFLFWRKLMTNDEKFAEFSTKGTLRSRYIV